MPSDFCFGETVQTTDLSAGIPILAMVGDSHAALFGHGIRTPGTVKATLWHRVQSDGFDAGVGCVH